MLQLTLDLQLDADGHTLPRHLGGVLHGFVEGAVLRHAVHCLPLLRPGGVHQPARFMIVAPPYDLPAKPRLRFGLRLYGAAATVWRDILAALLEQQDRGLHGRSCRIVAAHLAEPDRPPATLWNDHRIEADVPPPLVPASLSDRPTAPYHFRFTTPLLLASRKAQRRAPERLPWPSLGSLLDSIAERLRRLEPGLAEAIGLPSHWRAPQEAWAIHPLPHPEAAARQIPWEYTSTPRPKADAPPCSGRRTLHLQGIVGDLVYSHLGLAHERPLLYWGQWLGVGQKTTLGCGDYRIL